MSTDIHSKPATKQPSEGASEITRQVTDVVEDMAHLAPVAAKEVTGLVKYAMAEGADAAKEAGHTVQSKVEEGMERTKQYAQQAVDATKDAAQRATDTAKDMYQSVERKAEDTLATSKEYVRRNPVLAVVGALACGAAIGCLLMMTRRQPTFRERYVDEPLEATREAILAALAPVAQRLHAGYDSARDDALKVLHRVPRSNAARTADSLTRQIGRFGSNLKFW
jgi:ElaB/YqjD/DUF883 family membrane-anchored ribosome-binding protein